jgi:2-hydroxychromene-2-carboxylate isomerase
LFTAGYVDGLDTGRVDDVLGVAERLGHDRHALTAAIESPEIKALAKTMSGKAIERGVFGSPWMFVEGEPFWGWDRLGMLDDWLSRGGW